MCISTRLIASCLMHVNVHLAEAMKQLCNMIAANKLARFGKNCLRFDVLIVLGICMYKQSHRHSGNDELQDEQTRSYLAAPSRLQG